MLSFLETFQAGARQAVLASMPLASIEALDAGGRTGWFPLQHDRWIAEGMIAVLGPERAVQCWRACVPAMVDKPLLRSFVSGMLRLFDNDRQRIVRLFPNGWPLIYRDFCTVELVETHPARAVIAFSDIAPAVRDHPSYFHAFHGVIQGFCDFAGLSGAIFKVAEDAWSARAQLYWDNADPSGPRAQ